MKVAGRMSSRLATQYSRAMQSPRAQLCPHTFVVVAAIGILIATCTLVSAEESRSATTDWVEADLLEAFGAKSPESSAAAPSLVPPDAADRAAEEFPAATAESSSEPIVKPIDAEVGDVQVSSDEQSVDADEEELPSEPASPLGCDDPHQVWLISSRSISSCDDSTANVEQIRYWRYERDQGWLDASLEEFQASDDPAMPTVFFVHGHRIDQSYALSGGWDAYRAIVKPTAVPTRFVIYSWPTSPHGHPMREFRIRACESEVHGYYLAWVLDRIQPQVPIHLVGFSYGSRLITSALHYLGGGAIGSRSLDERVYVERVPMRASLIAGALDNDWLLPGRRHGQALTQVDRLFVTKNPIDPVLHWYPVVLRDRGAVALGVTGVAGLSRLGDERSKVAQLNVSQAIGKRHAIALYWEVDRVVGILRGMVDDVVLADVVELAAD